MEKPQRRQLITALASGLIGATVLSQIPMPAFASAPSRVTASADYIDFPTLSTLTPSTGRLASEYDAGGVITNMVYSQDNANIRYLRTEQSASYVIFIDTTDSNNIKARNGTTGKIDYSGTDAAAIISEAIAALTNGGRVLIKAGTYTINSTIMPTTSNIELCGEGAASILMLANGVNSRIIEPLGVTNWHIHHLAFDGNRANQSSTAVNCYNIQVGNVSSNIWIDHCYTHDAMTYGIYVFNSTNVFICDNYVRNCNANGIVIDNTLGGLSSVISGNTIDGVSDVGISIDSANSCVCSNNTIKNCTLGLSPFGVNSSYGIAVEGSNGRQIDITNNTLTTGPITFNGTASDITVSGNSIYNTAISSGAIFVEAACTQVTITDNVMDSCNGFIGISAGTDIMIIGNIMNNFTNAGDNNAVQFLVPAQFIGNIMDNIPIANAAVEIKAAGCVAVGNKISLGSSANYSTAIVCSTGATGTVIKGNTIDTGGTSNRNWGIYLTNAASNTIIEGNTFQNAGSNDYYVDVESSAEPVIINNQFLGSPSKQINDTGATNSYYAHNIGYNPVGKITNPFGTSTIGSGGTNVNPSSSTTYTAQGPDMVIVSTGGTGVSITVQDGHGNTIVSELGKLNAFRLCYGWTINFGAFNNAPTVTVYGE